MHAQGRELGGAGWGFVARLAPALPSVRAGWAGQWRIEVAKNKERICIKSSATSQPIIRGWRWVVTPGAAGGPARTPPAVASANKGPGLAHKSYRRCWGCRGRPLTARRCTPGREARAREKGLKSCTRWRGAKSSGGHMVCQRCREAACTTTIYRRCQASHWSAAGPAPRCHAHQHTTHTGTPTSTHRDTHTLRPPHLIFFFSDSMSSTSSSRLLLNSR